MTINIIVPTLGESVSEATVAKWLKAAGDPVKRDEALLELETDKVTLEVYASAAGKLAEHGTDLHCRPGGRPDLGELARRAGIDLQRHLVGFQFQERLVALDRIARGLQPLGDGGLAHGFAQRGYDDIDGHEAPRLALIPMR